MTKKLTNKEMEDLLKMYKSNKFSIGFIIGRLVGWAVTFGVVLTIAVWIKWGITALF